MGVCLHALVALEVSLAEHNCLKASELVKQGVAMGDASEAERDLYDQAFSLCPEMSEAVFNLGIVAQKRGDVATAEKHIRKALSLKTDSRFRVALGSLFAKQEQYEKAREQYQRVLESGEDNIGAYQGLAMVLQAEGKLQEAIDLLESAKTAQPLDATTALNMGIVYEMAHRFADASREYARAIEIDAGYVKAHYHQGMLKFRAGDVQDAKLSLERAVALDEKNIEALFGLAQVYEKSGEKRRAQRVYRRVITLDPSNFVARLQLASLLLDEHAYQEAVGLLEKALEVEPAISTAWSVYGRAQMELGQVANAEKSFKKAIALDATNATAHNNLGILYHRLDRVEEARGELQEALRLEPNNFAFEKNLKALKP